MDRGKGDNKQRLELKREKVEKKEQMQINK